MGSWDAAVCYGTQYKKITAPQQLKLPRAEALRHPAQSLIGQNQEGSRYQHDSAHGYKRWIKAAQR